MKRIIFYSVLVVGLMLLVYGLKPSRYTSDFDVQTFSRLPVQSGGRIKPMDSVARNALLVLQGKQTLRLPKGEKMEAIEWFMDVLMHPEKADAYPVFRIDNDQILGLCGWEQDRKYFSYNDLEPHLEKIYQQAQMLPSEAKQRSVFEQQIAKLTNALTLYHQMVNGLYAVASLDRIELDSASWLDSIVAAKNTVRLADEEEAEIDKEALGRFKIFLDYYHRLKELSPLGIVPPSGAAAIETDDWDNTGESLLGAAVTERLDPILVHYFTLIPHYRQGNVEAFNTELTQLFDAYRAFFTADPWKKIRFETAFNRFQPFYQSILLYVLAFVLVCWSWLGWTKPLQKGAFWLLVLALAIHTVGLLARMYIQGRPPVTNLYSSAVFVGWISVILGIFIERFSWKGLGTATAALIGFSTLIIAHHLSVSGDTLEMMRAVLDSNFWLATHVVVITIGYGAMFLAGVLATIYILRGVLTRSLDRATAKVLSNMVYGVVCFAVLFSFVGTLLGGIWADQSWGRFWGWDPKENGALLIVLWCALLLHARWGKLVRDRGVMVMAVFGNIVTAWSWFGTNMLGVGLHSYGFIDKAFFALAAFILSQLLIMAIGLLPIEVWRSNTIFKKV